LVLTTNATTVVWSFAAMAVTLIYPYAKRYVSMPQAVLGIAFSFGIPVAFAAVQSQVPLLAWVLLVGNLFWVLAYDTEYAMVDRDDDLRIGMKTSAITLGRWDVVAVLSFYLVQLAIWSWAIVPQPRAWAWWLGVLVVLAQVVWHATLIKDRTREGCFKAFRANHWVGFTLFAAIAVGFA
jgi:4-hydroxybenzoate polyprenyltransferase